MTTFSQLYMKYNGNGLISASIFMGVDCAIPKSNTPPTLTAQSQNNVDKASAFALKLLKSEIAHIHISYLIITRILNMLFKAYLKYGFFACRK